MDCTRYLRRAAILLFATSTAAAAQPASQGNAWTQGTTIGVFVGVASASSNSGALVGGAAGWEITPWFGVEGNVAWLDRPRGEEAFAAVLSVHATLMRIRPVVPFVKGGIGLYRASFDGSRDEVPDFYRRRFAAGSSAPGMRHTFTDPSFVVGVGVNWFATRHMAIRPEIEAIAVRRDSRNYVVTAVTIHLAYHFEEHPVTPARERQ